MVNYFNSLLKKLLLSTVFIVLAFVLKSQTVFKVDAKEINSLALPSAINNTLVYDLKGAPHECKTYLLSNKKFYNKPYLFILWGTGDGNRGLESLKEIQASKLGKEYNLVGLYVNFIGLGSEKMNEALEKNEVKNQFTDILMVATNFDFIKSGFWAESFPLHIFATSTLDKIFVQEVMPAANATIMLQKIDAGFNNNQKLWFTKEGYVINETDNAAKFYKQFENKGNQSTLTWGNKEKILFKQSFVREGGEFLFNGDVFAQTETGIITAKGKFANGIPVDSFKTYNQSGKLASYYPVNGTYKRFNDVGKIIASGPVKNGLGNGLFNSFENGKLVESLNYVAGIQSGIQKKIDDKGVVSEWFVLPGYKQTGFLNNGLEVIEKDKKFGYIDRTGKIVIPLEYDNAYEFKNGKATAFIGDQEFILDNKGIRKEVAKVVVPKANTYIDRYDLVNPFATEGFRWVKLNNKFGFIDDKGVEVSAPIYDKVSDFHEGMAAVRLDGKMGFINTLGKVVIPITYLACDDFEDGIARAALSINGENKYGYLGKTGKEIIPVKFKFPSRLGNKYIQVPQGNKYAIYNYEGKMIQEALFDRLWSYHNNMLKFQVGEKMGYINEQGKIVIDAMYSSASNFEDGVATVALQGNEFKINIKGEKIK